jgi:hypothetical protein
MPRNRTGVKIKRIQWALMINRAVTPLPGHFDYQSKTSFFTCCFGGTPMWFETAVFAASPRRPKSINTWYNTQIYDNKVKAICTLMNRNMHD